MAKKTGGKSHQATAHRGKARKEAIVAKLSEKVQRAKGMVFANYQGLTHHQLESLKRAVKKAQAEFIATKNTLLLRALEQLNLSEEDRKFFAKPTATLFTYADPIEPIKALAKLIKETKLPEIKFGFLDGKSITASDIEKLATLPSLLQLRAQLVGTLNSPIQGLHRTLNWNLVKLAMTIQAISDKKKATMQ
ncbi:MAG: 50S ribosomal protein L10 [Candidatus Levybacteria bacterium]|nr:50S ribosomal protein L10 [Candidatus Levybacteria bacterium]